MVWAYASTLGLIIVGFLLMVIILLQRGRGGGLAGAFGGLGGQSAFGTKAGDVFTKITVVLAVLWVALAGASIWALEKGTASRYQADVPDDPVIQTAEEATPADMEAPEASGTDATDSDAEESNSDAEKPSDAGAKAESDKAASESPVMAPPADKKEEKTDEAKPAEPKAADK